MIATGFHGWVEKKRKQAKLSQAQLARLITKNLADGTEFTRDRVWQLEHGQPETPKPALVSAVADAVQRPIAEALEALGYEIPRSGLTTVHPKLIEAMNEVPWSTQEQLAEILPALIGLAGRVAQVSTPSVPTEIEAVSSNVKEPAATSEMLSTRGERRETESAQQSDIPSAAEGVHKNVPVLPREVESVDQTIRRRRPPAR